MTLETAARALNDSLVDVRSALTDLGTQLRALSSVGFFGPDHLPEMSRQLEGVARRALATPDSVIVGAGVAWEVGPQQGQSGMLWWRADGGRVTQKIHVDNPRSDSYYDFTHSQWYRRAVEYGELGIVGPFIDAWGTDDHTLTPSIVVADETGTRLGVAAADLDLDGTTSRLSKVLEPFGSDLILVNDEGQVVVANDHLLTPGLRLDPFLAGRSMHVAESVAVPVDGWRLLHLTAD